MKNIIKLLLCIILCFILVGCTKEIENTSSVITPNITSYEHNSDDFYYIVDNNTGVVYLAFRQFGTAGLSAMFNVDGTPITIDQLMQERTGGKNDSK